MSLRSYLSRHKWLLLLTVAAIFARLYRLADLPYGIDTDEAGMAYDAWCLANYGVDRYLLSWPVYLINFGSGQSALYAYLTAGLIKIFGFSVTVIRLPAVAFSLLAYFFGLKIVRLIWKGEKPLLVFAGLYVIVPYFTMAARFGLDCNLMLGASTAFLYCLMKAAKTRRTKDYVISGAVGGMLLYTYALTYVVVPVFLLCTLAWLLWQKRIRFSQVLCLGGALFVLALPLLLTQYVNLTGMDSLRIGIFTIPKMPLYRAGEFSRPRLSSLLATLKAAFVYDGLEFNSLSAFWTLYALSVPFACAGLVRTALRVLKAVRAKKIGVETHAECMLLFWFFAMLLVGSMLQSIVNTSRINGIFLVSLYFVAAGVLWLCEIALPWRRVAAVATAAAYLFFGAGFYRYYFVTQPNLYPGSPYPQQMNLFFGPNLEQALSYVRDTPAFAGKTLYIGDIYECPIYYLFGARPSPYAKESLGGVARIEYALPDSVDPEGVYIEARPANGYAQTMDEAAYGFTAVDFDGCRVLYRE